MPISILEDPPTKREAAVLIAAMAMSDNRARCHLTTRSVNEKLAMQGLKGMDAAAITRARTGLIARGWLLPSGIHTGLYFLNPHLFPPNLDKNTWHNRLCEEWDRGMASYRAEHPVGSVPVDFSEVEGL